MAVVNEQPASEHERTSRPASSIIESNLAEYWLALGHGPSGEVHDSHSIRWVYSGTPFFNRVVAASIDSGHTDQVIEQVTSVFRERRAAVTWLVGPSTRPADLGARLSSSGFSRYEDWIGMMHDLDELDIAPVNAANIQVRPVSGDAAQRHWLEVVSNSFDLPQPASDVLREHIRRVGPDDATTWHHNLAYLNGLPVAASTLFLSQDVAGIYLVSTVPGARHRGLGTMMTWLALQRARELGCRKAVLQATSDGQRVYEKLGFYHCCDIEVYRVPAPEPLWSRIARSGARRIRARISRNGRAPATLSEETDSSGTGHPGGTPIQH